MKRFIYLYVHTDHCLREKVKLIRKNVSYVKKAEKSSVIELAMLMKEEIHPQGSVILQKGQKIDKLLFVLDGQLEMHLGTGGPDILFERLAAGSCLGQFSFLRQSNA